MGKRELKKEENRQAILSAAKTVFSEKGYHNSSISDILRQTDFSRGTFYLYFQDKEEIFETLAEILFNEMLKDITRINISGTHNKLNFKLILENVLSNLFITLHKHSELVKIFLNSPTGIDKKFDKIVQKYIDRLTNSIKTTIVMGKNFGIFRTENPDLTTHLVFGGLKEIVYQWLVTEKYKLNIEKEIIILTQFYLR